MKLLRTVAASSGYWLALLLLAVALEATALYYQYALDFGPCVLCIQVRIWVLVLALVALPALAVYKVRAWRLGAHLLTTLVLGALVTRAWLLLGTERGFVQGECNFDLGLPVWLPLDQWFPTLFQVHEACGYTPSLPVGFTMAEVLLPLSGVLLLLSLALLLVTMWRGSAVSRPCD